MRLVAVELRRVVARRLITFVTIGGLLAVGLVLVAAWQSARPLTDAQIAEAERQYAWALEDWEENGEQMVADCLDAQAGESELAGEPLDFGCAEMEPQREWYVPPSSELSTALGPLLSSTATLLVFLVFVVGVTATAAEMTTGSMSTWLTFVPQRLRVLFSKVAASGVVGVPITAVLAAVLVGGAYGVHAAQGALGTMTGAVWADVGWTGLRVVVLGGVAAAVGSALGVLLKNTGVALGLVIGYLLVVEAILGNLVQPIQPFLLQTNLRAWVEGGTTYWVSECTVTDQGTQCTGTEVALGLAQGAAYLGVGAVLVLGLTALVFRRRDLA
ncbi:MAG: ABC transporter permease subunit [Actinotalea sp.]|nr:ABC transporter permease subunit [Actinotalea sp.]